MLAIDAVAHDRELIGPEAADRVAGADDRLDRLRGLDQDAVARAVAEAVVDELEAIDVDEQHRDATARGLGAAQRELEVVEEQEAVGQPGQGVVQRLVVELALEARALDRVTDGAADEAPVGLRLEEV